MHVYGYNIDTNNQSNTLMHLVQDVEKAEVKIEIPPSTPSAGGDTAPHILVATS